MKHALGGLILLALLSPAVQAGPTGEPDPALKRMLRQAIESSSSFQDKFDAEVWLTDMSTRLEPTVPDTQERLDMLRLIHREAKRAKLPPELVLSVIDVESDFNRFAVSNAGAQGLMQIMPFWLKEIGHPKDNLFNMQTNLRMGCTILRYYLDKEHGQLRKALARYNGSRGRREYSDKVLMDLSQKWFRQ